MFCLNHVKKHQILSGIVLSQLIEEFNEYNSKLDFYKVFKRYLDD